jgi:hypothetical protein
MFKKQVAKQLREKYDPSYSSQSKEATQVLSPPIVYLISKFCIEELLVTTLPISQKELQYFLQKTCEMNRNLLSGHNSEISEKQKSSTAKNWLILISALLNSVIKDSSYKFFSYEGSEELDIWRKKIITIRMNVMPLAEECLIYVQKSDPTWISSPSLLNQLDQFELICAQYWLVESAYIGPESIPLKHVKTWRFNLWSMEFFLSHSRNPIVAEPTSSM